MNQLPSVTHNFIGLLESRGKLTRNYTQNIDGLEHHANISNVFNCHGIFSFMKKGRLNLPLVSIATNNIQGHTFTNLSKTKYIP